MSSVYRLPEVSLRWIPIWRRNIMVWRRLVTQSIIGNVAEPVITLLAFGYGLGSMLPPLDGVTYIAFLASGAICMNTFNAATFESLYSAFTRMHVQRSWEAMMNAPLSLDDVVLAEMLWAATKSVFTGVAVLAVIAVLGISREPFMLLTIPLLLVIGMTAASIGLVINALARNYDFFTYYFTLVVTPMWFLSGVFFPIVQMPWWLQAVSSVLPLTAAVNLVRPLILGHMPQDVGFNLLILLGYIVVALYAAVVLTRRRLLK
jgi:lipooligosaccharide transport system permease protein